MSIFSFTKKKNIKIEPEPATDNHLSPVEPIDYMPSFNLIFHFHCVDHEKIFYAISKIQQHIDIFNGYKIFTLSSPNNRFFDNEIFKKIVNTFKKYDRVIFIPVNNNLKTRESDHFFVEALPLLIQLADMPNKKSYTFYAHSKGCTHEEKNYAITCWVNTLYKYNLDLFDKIVKKELLSNKYKFIGCLKIDSKGTFGSDKHYAGTFFWFDSDIVRSDWFVHKKHPLALEMWPDTITHESDMLSLWDPSLPEDNNFYRKDYWYNMVLRGTVDQPKTITNRETI